MINATVTIDIPSDRICNWYQKCTSIVNKIGSEDGCSWTCALDVANIHGPSAYAPRNMPDSAWGSLGCTWELPDTCTGSIAGYTSYSDKSECLEAICNEIDNNRPVIVELKNSSAYHYVVAYGYTGNGDDETKILVFDPGVNGSSTNHLLGSDCTLEEAGINNYNKSMSKRVRFTSGR